MPKKRKATRQAGPAARRVTPQPAAAESPAAPALARALELSRPVRAGVSRPHVPGRSPALAPPPQPAVAELPAPARRAHQSDTPSRPLRTVPGQVTDESGNAEAVHGVAATYWVEAGAPGAGAAVRFTGTGVDGEASGQRFERTMPVPVLPAGAGRAAVTANVQGLRAGTWRVIAQRFGEDGLPAGAAQQERVRSRFGPLVRGPGVRPLAWPALVVLGVLLAVLVQAVLVRSAGLDVAASALSAVAAAAVGYVVAKAAYMVVHRVPLSGFPAAGTLIQGFLVGAFTALVGFAWLADLPVPRLLDLTTPGVFAAMALARPGCWLGGCCAGRATASRWGLWSSDRRIAVRRVPVQLLESGLAVAVSLTGLTLLLMSDPRPAGVVLALSAALYTLGRQALFPLRAESRRTSRGRVAVAAVAAAVAATSVLALALHS